MRRGANAMGVTMACVLLPTLRSGEVLFAGSCFRLLLRTFSLLHCFLSLLLASLSCSKGLGSFSPYDQYRDTFGTVLAGGDNLRFFTRDRVCDPQELFIWGFGHKSHTKSLILTDRIFSIRSQYLPQASGNLAGRSQELIFDFF